MDELNSELISSWRRSISSDDVICLKHLVSSANLNSCDVTTDGKSLINIRKSMGPRMLPCGTPKITGKVLDK